MINKGQFCYPYFGEEKTKERGEKSWQSSGKGMELRSEPQTAHSSQCHLEKQNKFSRMHCSALINCIHFDIRQNCIK